MGGYTILRLTDVRTRSAAPIPGEMRFLTGALETEQLAFTYRRMPQGSGGKGSYGHRHPTQEEIYFFLFSGRLEAKLDDEVVELEARTALRVAPQVVRSLWNAEPEDAELMIVSVRLEDPGADGRDRPGLLARVGAPSSSGTTRNRPRRRCGGLPRGAKISV